MLKRILLLATGLTLAWSLSAQHESVFGRARVVGAFGAPIVEMGLNNELSSAIGGGGGLVINSIFLGAYGMANLNLEELIETGDVQQLEMGHGGLWVGFTISPQSLIHLYGSGRIGWGVVNVSLDRPISTYQELDKIFVATPEIGLELNITRWLRAVGTIGYRYVDGVGDWQSFTNKDLSGAVIGMSLRIGWFGNRRGW